MAFFCKLKFENDGPSLAQNLCVSSKNHFLAILTYKNEVILYEIACIRSYIIQYRASFQLNHQYSQSADFPEPFTAYKSFDSSSNCISFSGSNFLAETLPPNSHPNSEETKSFNVSTSAKKKITVTQFPRSFRADFSLESEFGEKLLQPEKKIIGGEILAIGLENGKIQLFIPQLCKQFHSKPQTKCDYCTPLQILSCSDQSFSVTQIA